MDGIILSLSHKLGFDDLRLKKRDQYTSTARQAVMFFLNLQGMGVYEIASLIQRSRSTVIHNLKTFKGRLETNDRIAVGYWDKINSI